MDIPSPLPSFDVGDSPVTHHKAKEEKPRFILLHNGLVRSLWDCLILLATFYISVSIPFEVIFMPHEVEDRPTLQADLVAEVLFVLDIILNFRTTYQNKLGRMVFDARSICIHYLHTWFIIDLVAALPVDLLYVFNLNVSNLIHLLKTVHLLRLLRLLGKLDRYAQQSSLVLTMLMSSYVLLAHWMACIWYLIGQHDLKSNQWHVGWLYELGECQETPYINSSFGGPSVRSSYIAALYFTISSLTTVGFGNVSPNTDTEKIFSICVMLIGALMHALIFANVIAIIQRMYARRSKYHTRMTNLNTFSNVYHLPREVRQRLLEHVEITWIANNGINVTEVLNDIPDHLRADINMHLYKDIIHFPVFKKASCCCLRSLSFHISATFCFPGQYVCFQGEVLNAFYFVRSGSLEVLRENRLLAKIESGSLIGSDLPEQHQLIKTNGRVVAVDHCYLLSLSIQGLRQVQEQYPEFGRVFNADIRNHLTYNLREGNPDQGRIGHLRSTELPHVGFKLTYYVQIFNMPCSDHLIHSGTSFIRHLNCFRFTKQSDHRSSSSNICDKLISAFHCLSPDVRVDETFLFRVQQDFLMNHVASEEAAPSPSTSTDSEYVETQTQLLTNNQRLQAHGENHHSPEFQPGLVEERDRDSTFSYKSGPEQFIV